MSKLSKDFTLEFVGVGAAKAGTTWLATCLQEHPQVCIPEQKELYYFSTTNIRRKIPLYENRGEAWLQDQFKHCQPGQIRGEISTVYLVDPQVPKLIKQCYPYTKILVSYRNPADRLYSLYFHYNREFAVPGTFEGFLKKYPHLIETGFYYSQTQRYLELFPRENMHFILFDDIGHDPQNVLRQLFAFLGIETAYSPPSLHAKVNTRKTPRSALLRNLIGSSRDMLNSDPRLQTIKQLLVRAGIERLANQLYAANLRGASIPPMRAETRAWLQEIYAKENRLLGNFLERDLEYWNS